MFTTVDYGMFEKGYRYRLTPVDKSFKPLYTKLLTEVGPLMRDYPNKRFDVDTLGRLKAGRSLMGSFFGPGTLVVLKNRQDGSGLNDVTAFMPNGKPRDGVLPNADLER
jgi:hypothetical protein